MNIAQLKYLIAVAEEATFLDAAEQTHISQSSLSKQIVNLERELNCQLLDRSHRKAELTEAGRIMYKEALLIYAEYEKALNKLSACSYSEDNTIRLGTLPILAQYDLTRKFSAFKHEHESIRLSSQEMEENQLMRSLENGTCDMIICRQSMVDSNRMQSVIIAEDELVAVAALKHPILDKSSASLKSIFSYELMLMNPYTSIYQLCIDTFKRNGLTANVTGNARIETIINYISLSDAVSLLPRSSLAVFSHTAVDYRPLKPKIDLPVMLVSLKSKHETHAMQELSDYLGINR